MKIKHKVLSYISNVPDDYYLNSPDDYEEGTEIEIEDYIEFSFSNIEIVVDRTGNWEYTDDSYSFAAPNNNPKKWWRSNEYYDIELDDCVGVVEKIDDLVETRIPSVPGTYYISGDVEFQYDISNILEIPDKYDHDSFEIYTDSAEVDFNKEKSSVNNFSVKII